jgi:hypothetical protein
MVSGIIPITDLKSTLETCLKSGQNYQKIETIIVNNYLKIKLHNERKYGSARDKAKDFEINILVTNVN